MSTKETGWQTEPIKQAPIPAVLLIAAFFFYKYVDFWPGLILLISSIIISTVLFRNEQHRRDVSILEKRAEKYHKMAMEASKHSNQTLAETSRTLGENIGGYNRVEPVSTETE